MSVRLILLALVALMATTPGARAQGDTRPEPCNGLLQVADDDEQDPSADKDVLGAFFRFDDGTATANIVLETASPALGSSATEAFWRVVYDVAGTRRWVGLRLSRPLLGAPVTTTYEHGTYTGDFSASGGYTTAGATSGRVFTGGTGVVQIDIPAAAGGEAGTVLAGPVAVTWEGNALSGGYEDRTSPGADYTVAPCAPPPSADQDADDDGIDDGPDNCDAVANADQADLDGDGAGDACDADQDGDTIDDAAEASAGSDPRRPDSDGDGVRDDLDACPTQPAATAGGCPPATDPGSGSGTGQPGGGTPLPSGTQTAGVRAIELTSGSRRVRRGANYLVTGRIDPPRGAVPVEIAAAAPDGRILRVLSTLTGSDGSFALRLAVPQTMIVVARVERTFSKPVAVTLIPSVALRAKQSHRAAGRFTAVFSGRVSPSLAERVTIQRQAGRRWVRVASARVRRGSFRVRATRLRAGRYRARVVGSSGGVAAYSGAKRLR